MSTDQIYETIAGYMPQAAAAALTLLLGYLAVRIVTAGLRRGLARARVDETLIAFTTNLTYMAGLVLVVISTLGALGVNTTSFAAVVAAAGLAIGFALQGSLANFASGVMLIFFRPFKAGDFVEAAGISGIVEEIQVFATVLRTGDNKRIIVPNAGITGGPITNYSANDTRRIDLVFGIAYGDDLLAAKRVLEEIVATDERILKEPAPAVAVAELADSSVNFNVRPWVKTADYWDVRADVIERVKLEFDKREISIPFPQTDVHLHHVA